MKLIVYTDTAVDAGSGRCAGGVVVVDAEAARPIHEGGYVLDAAGGEHCGGGPHVAAYEAVLRAMGVIEPLGVEDLDLRCRSQRLVNQLTGVEPIEDAAVEALYERVMAGLLRIDTWRVGIDRDEARRARELAGASLAKGTDVVWLDPDAAAAQQQERHTGVPQWTVELLEEPGIDCPARCHMGVRYAFGPDTPAGFCVHAARVAIADGPLAWRDAEQTRMTTTCPYCDVPVQVEVVR